MNDERDIEWSIDRYINGWMDRWRMIEQWIEIYEELDSSSFCNVFICICEYMYIWYICMFVYMTRAFEERFFKKINKTDNTEKKYINQIKIVWYFMNDLYDETLRLKYIL